MFAGMLSALVASLVAAPGAPAFDAPAPLAFPVDVVTPTPTESIGIAQNYAVREGKLWWRAKQTNGAWALFDGTGLPPGTTRPVVAVFSDEDAHFTVATSDGLLHHHENGAWDSLWGLPSLPFTRDHLALPFPLARLREGRVAYSMRHKNVLFYEDTRGGQFHWGDAGTTSLYLLSIDGKRILFADPWLPPDYAREVCTPEQCSVTLASLAASASTLFVMANNGDLFTRFEDYDENGGTPLFDYDYRPDHAAAPPPAGKVGTDLSSSSQTRLLPGDDWHAQPPIALTGKARLSRRIAIVQTGQGNSARELRVIGDDAYGVRGVYSKSLAAPSWTFRAVAEAGVDVSVADDAWIDPRAASREPVPALSYRGGLRVARSPMTAAALNETVSARTDDFWFHRTPFHITLTVDGVDVELVAHAVDTWTLFTEVDPVDDDTASKRLKVTLFLARDAAGQPPPLSPHTRARLDEIFRGDLDKPFAFAAVANQHELVVTPVSYPFNTARSRWLLVMRHDAGERAREYARLRPATRVARAIVDLDAAGSITACAASAALRGHAATALARVRALRSEAERRLAVSSALEVGLPAGTALVDAVTIVSTTRFTLDVTRWLNFLELHVPSVLAGPALAYQRYLEGARADFDDVTTVLTRCVSAPL